MAQLQIQPDQIAQIAAKRDQFPDGSPERAVVDQILGAVPADAPMPGQIDQQAAYNMASRGFANPADNEAFAKTYYSNYFGLDPSYPLRAMTAMVHGSELDATAAINYVKGWTAKVTPKDDPYDQFNAMPADKQVAEAVGAKPPSIGELMGAASLASVGKVSKEAKFGPDQFSPEEQRKLIDQHRAKLRAESTKYQILDSEKALPSPLLHQVRFAVASKNETALADLAMAAPEHAQDIFRAATALAGAYDGNWKPFAAVDKGTKAFIAAGRNQLERLFRDMTPLQGETLYENLASEFKGKLPEMVDDNGKFKTPEAEYAVREALVKFAGRGRIDQALGWSDPEQAADQAIADFSARYTQGKAAFERRGKDFNATRALAQPVTGSNPLSQATYGALGMVGPLALGAMTGGSTIPGIFAVQALDQRDRLIFDNGNTPLQADAITLPLAVATGLIANAQFAHQVPGAGAAYDELVKSVFDFAQKNGVEAVGKNAAGIVGPLVAKEVGKRAAVNIGELAALNEVQAVADRIGEHVSLTLAGMKPKLSDSAYEYLSDMPQRILSAAVFGGPKVLLDSIAAGVVGKRMTDRLRGTVEVKPGDAAKHVELNRAQEAFTGKPFDLPDGQMEMGFTGELDAKARSVLLGDVTRAMAAAEQEIRDKTATVSRDLPPDLQAAQNVGESAKPALTELVDKLKAKFPALNDTLAVEAQGPALPGMVAEGATENGVARVYESGVKNPLHALEVAAHELGHRGLQAQFGAELQPLTESVVAMLGRDYALQTTGAPEFYGKLADAKLGEEYLARVAGKLIDGEKLDVKERDTWTKVQDWASDRLGYTSRGEIYDRALAEFMRRVLKRELTGEGAKPEPPMVQGEMAFSARPAELAGLTKIVQKPEPAEFKSVDDVLAFRRERMAEERALFVEQIGLTPEQAAKLQQLLQDEYSTARFEKTLDPEKQAKFVKYFEESVFNKRGGPFETIDHSSHGNPEEVARQTDPTDLAASLVKAVRSNPEERVSDDAYASALIAAKRLQEVGGTQSDIARFLDRRSTSASSSQGDKEFLFRQEGGQVVAFLARHGIELPVGDLGPALPAPVSRPELSAAFSARPAAPETPEFKRWFGESKVVDEQGKPLVVYHGTNAEFTKFRRGASGQNTGSASLGSGFYFTPSEETAATWGKKVMPVHVSVENPYIFHATRPDWESQFYEGFPTGRKKNYAGVVTVDETRTPEGVTRFLAKQGYDGVFMYQDGKLAEVVAFNPEQIKAQDNQRPTSNPDINFSARPAPQSDAAVSLAYRMIKGETIGEADARRLVDLYYQGADPAKALERAQRLASGRTPGGKTPADLVYELRKAEVANSVQERVIRELANIKKNAQELSSAERRAAVAEGKASVVERADDVRRSMLGLDMLVDEKGRPGIEQIIREVYKAGREQGRLTGVETTLESITAKRERDLKITTKAARENFLTADLARLESVEQSLAADPAKGELDARAALTEIFGKDEFQRLLSAQSEGKTGKARQQISAENLVGKLKTIYEANLRSGYAAEVVHALGRPDSRPENLTPSAKQMLDAVGSKFGFPVDEARALATAQDKLKMYEKMSEGGTANSEDVKRAEARVEKAKQAVADYFEGKPFGVIDELRRAIGEAVAASNREKDQIRAMRGEARGESRNLIVDEVKRTAKQIFKQGDSVNRDRFAALLRGDMNVNMHGWAEMVSGGRGTRMYEMIARRPVDSEDMAKGMNHRMTHAFYDKAKELGISQTDVLVKYRHDSRPVTIGDVTQNLSTGELIDIYLMAKDPGTLVELGRGKLKAREDWSKQYGFGFKDAATAKAEIERVTAKELTPKQRELADWMQKSIVEPGVVDGLNKVSYWRQGTFEFGRNEYYWPRIRDISDSPTKNGAEDLEDMAEKRRASLENIGFAQRRSTSARDVLYGDAFGKYSDHLDNISRYTHLTIPLADARAILAHPAVYQAVSERWGDKGRRFVMDSLAKMSGEVELRKRDKIISTIENAYMTGLLWGRVTSFFNARVAGSLLAEGELLQQYGPSAAAEFGKHYVLGGPSKLYWRGERAQGRKDIMEDGYFQHRVDRPLEIYGQLYRAGAKSSGAADLVKANKLAEVLGVAQLATKKVREFGLNPLVEADMKTAVGIYLAIRSEGYSKAEAIARTKDIIRTTQPASSAADETRAYRFMRPYWLVSPFQSAPSMVAAMIKRDIVRWQNASPGEKATALKNLGITTVAAALQVMATRGAARLVYARATGSPVIPEEDDKKLALSLQVLSEMADVTVSPGSGTALRMLGTMVTRGRMDEITPLARQGSDLAKMGNLFYKAANDPWGDVDMSDPETQKKILKGAEAAAVLSGIPMSGPLADLRMLTGPSDE